MTLLHLKVFDIFCNSAYVNDYPKSEQWQWDMLFQGHVHDGGHIWNILEHHKTWI
jgi:hypothetical protein